RQRMSNSQKPFTERGMPTHQQLVLPVLRSLSELGGSAKSREILDHVIDSYPDAERLMDMVYPKNPDQQVFLNRAALDRKSTRLNSSHVSISYAVFCLKKKTGYGLSRRELPPQSCYQQRDSPV